MRLNRRRAGLLREAITDARTAGAFTDADADLLLSRIEVVSFDWRRLAKYSFWIAVACLVVAVSSALADRALLRLIQRLITFTAAGRALALSAVAAAFYAASLRRKRAHPERTYGNEALCFLGVLATAGAVQSVGAALDTGSGHFSILLLLAALVYGAIGIAFPSAQVWVFALLSFASWIGFESGYVSGWGAYYLGMNYPLRFVFLGAALAVASHAFLAWPARAYLWKPTFVVGLLYLFVALWIMSIFGNYGDMHEWSRAGYGSLLGWCVLFAAASGLAIWYGLTFDDQASIGFGITFLFINLYTRFFEHFWNSLHKAAFFAVLAVSFWFLGSRAERIWTLGGRVESKQEPR